MPTTRRKQAATAASRNQQTLSFNNKSARVTKPSVHDTSASGKKAQSKLSEPVEVEVVEDTTVQTPEPANIQAPADDQTEQEQAPEEISVPVRPSQPRPRKKKSARSSASSVLSSRETAASKISDSQLKKYWKAEEDSRLAPRGTPLTSYLSQPPPSTFLADYHFSTSIPGPLTRENPSALRPLFAVRTLYRHPTPGKVETC